MKSQNRNSQSCWNILDEELANLNMCLVGAPKHPHKQSLLKAISQQLNIDDDFLHQSISTQLQLHCKNSTLPRKLSNIYNDTTIIDDYKKDHSLVSFAKITLEMVSMIYQRKIFLYSIGKDQFLTAVIVNEGGYSDSKIIRIGKLATNSYAKIQEIIPSNDLTLLSGEKKISNSKQENHSEQFYEAFKSETFLQIKADNDQSNLKNRSNLVQSTTFIAQRPSLRSKPSVKFEKNSNFGQNLSIKVQQDNENASINILVRNSTPINPMQEAQDHKLIGQTNNLNIKNVVGKNNGNIINVPPNMYHMLGNHTSSMNDILNEPEMGEYHANHHYNAQMYYQQIDFYGNGNSQNGNNRQYSNSSHHHINRSQPHITLGSSHQVGVSPQKKINNLATSMRADNSSTSGIAPTNQKQRYTGRLKFFDEIKNYGFIIMDLDDTDIFVHYDDIQKAGISRQRVRAYRQNEGLIKFSFKVMMYVGKYKESRKAVDLIIVENDFNPISNAVS